MTKAELEVLYMRVVGALDAEFRERGWLPPAQPQTPRDELARRLAYMEEKYGRIDWDAAHSRPVRNSEDG